MTLFPKCPYNVGNLRFLPRLRRAFAMEMNFVGDIETANDILNAFVYVLLVYVVLIQLRYH